MSGLGRRLSRLEVAGLESSPGGGVGAEEENLVEVVSDVGGGRVRRQVRPFGHDVVKEAREVSRRNKPARERQGLDRDVRFEER